MWRGVRVSNDPVVQSEVLIKKGIFEVNLFGNIDVTNENDNGGDFTEMDVTFGINKEILGGGILLRQVNLLAGISSFNYPNTDTDSTVELYAGFDITLPMDIHSKTVANFDIDEVEGAYVSQDFFKDFNLVKFGLLGRDCTLVAKPDIGAGWGSQDYNEYYFNEDSHGISNWHAGLSLMVVNDRFEFGPSVSYTDLWNDNIRDNVADDENVTVGFSALYRF
jgi:hypothetical protein